MVPGAADTQAQVLTGPHIFGILSYQTLSEHLFFWLGSWKSAGVRLGQTEKQDWVQFRLGLTCEPATSVVKPGLTVAQLGP